MSEGTVSFLFCFHLSFLHFLKCNCSGKLVDWEAGGLAPSQNKTEMCLKIIKNEFSTVKDHLISVEKTSRPIG